MMGLFLLSVLIRLIPGTIALNRMSDYITETVDVFGPSVFSLGQVESRATRVLAETLSFALFSELGPASEADVDATEGELTERDAAFEEMQTWLASYKALASDSEALSLVDTLEGLTLELDQASSALISAKQEDSSDALVLAHAANLEDVEEDILYQANQSVMMALGRYEQGASDLNDLLAQMFTNQFLTAMIGVVVVGVLSYSLFKSTSNLKRLMDVTTRIGGGDYAVEVAVEGKDEVGELATALSQMAKKIGASTEELRASNDRLQALLAEKDVLLKEVHHRVKNNLQVISSLLSLQSGEFADRRTTEACVESQRRIRSIALVHEQLYQSEVFSQVNIVDYVRKLAKELLGSFAGAQGKVKLRIEGDDIPVKITQAVPLGLILNELVTNALKHAFLDDGQGEIYVKVEAHDDRQVTLTVGDNGVGFDGGLEEFQDSLGLSLVTGLVKQIEGTIEVDSQHGAEYRITFEAG